MTEPLNTQLTIWDAEGTPIEDDGGQIVLWRSYGESACPEAISIPQLIEENADTLRSRYLAWVHALGEIDIRGRRLVDVLKIRSGFSYWWMAPTAEKCNYAKSPHITDAIRLLAFADWIAAKSVKRIVLHSENRQLAGVFKSWAKNAGIVFEWNRLSYSGNATPLSRKLYRKSPYPVQGLLWLARYLLRRWPLRGVGVKEWRESKATVAFVSYLFNLVPDAYREGRFESRYWAHLPEALRQEGIGSNWLHLYVESDILPDPNSAADAIRRFNQVDGAGRVHTSLDSFLGIGVVGRTVKEWIRLFWISRRVKHFMHERLLGGFDVALLYEEEWVSAFWGAAALTNLLHFHLLEKAFAMLPKQNVGVYLQENQPWELAFLHAWKTAGHGVVVGAPHSTVRYWDLRYFFDGASYRDPSVNALPLPDKVAVNGTASMAAYRCGGYPADALYEVEALRYLHLARPRGNGVQRSAGVLTVLVLGDYLSANTRQQMEILEGIGASLPEGVKLLVKPHPICPIDPLEYPAIRFDISTRPIEELLDKCDLAYTSAVTSAAVDAYCAGMPIVSVLNPADLNLSPLRGYEGIRFVSNSVQLLHIIEQALAGDISHIESPSYFTVDSPLRRWKSLLFDAIGKPVASDA